MDFDWLASIFIPAVVAAVSVYVTLRLLPLDLKSKQSTVISSLYDTVEKLVKDLRETNERWEKELKDTSSKLEEENGLLREKIEKLESLKEIILKAEMHIRLDNPPTVSLTRVEYLSPEDCKLERKTT